MDGVVELLHQPVHVVAAPVVTREHAAGRAVARIRDGIRELDQAPAPVALLVRIEVVVDMHAIDVVALHHVEDHPHRVRAHGLIPGVHPAMCAVRAHHRRPLVGDVIRRQRSLRRRMSRAIGIEPRVQLEPALVRLCHRELQRIPHRPRRDALASGQILRPRLDVGLVQRIGRRPHLEDHRVQPARLGPIQQRDQLALGLRRGKSRRGGPVDVGDAGDPHAAELTGQPRRHAARIEHAAALGRRPVAHLRHRRSRDRGDRRKSCDRAKHRGTHQRASLRRAHHHCTT